MGGDGSVVASLDDSTDHLTAWACGTCVLHSWNQKLGLHPHVHCVIPAGGLSLDHTHWVKSRDRFFLSIHVLRRVFRGKFVAALKQAFRDQQLVSCAASSCTFFPKALCASATSAFSPTAGAPRSCRFAFICLVQRRRQSKTYQAAKTQVIFGDAQNAVTDDSHRKTLLPRSNFVLLRPWSSRPHETTLYHKKSWRVSARSISLCVAVPQTVPCCFPNFCLGANFALSPPFHLSLSSVVLSRTVSAHYHAAPSFN
jgi:hypothetical protein